MKKLSPNFIKVTNLLSSENYQDGTTMGNTLKISRTAVWKIIKKLEQYGVPIKSVKGKGYTLLEPLVLLDAKKIQDDLDKPIKIDVFEHISSTIDFLLKYLNNTEPRACLAETQTHGVGRFQRQWYSPFGQNIYLSVLYPFENDMSELSGLSLVIGLAICHAIEQCYSLPQGVKIKWPNDIICEHLKLAGSLIQIHAETNGFCNAIISVGLNVNMVEDINSNITQGWTSIRKLNNQHNDRNELCVALINSMMKYIERFQSQGLGVFIDEWESKDYLFGQNVKLSCAKEIFSGVGQGINKRGHLVLKLQDGSIREFSSGDTSFASNLVRVS